MDTEKTEPFPRTYDAIMGEMNAKFNKLMDDFGKNNPSLDPTRGEASLSDFEEFFVYLEQTLAEVNASGLSEKFRKELIGVLESRKATAENYRKI